MTDAGVWVLWLLPAAIAGAWYLHSYLFERAVKLGRIAAFADDPRQELTDSFKAFFKHQELRTGERSELAGRVFQLPGSWGEVKEVSEFFSSTAVLGQGRSGIPDRVEQRSILRNWPLAHPQDGPSIAEMSELYEGAGVVFYLRKFKYALPFQGGLNATGESLTEAHGQWSIEASSRLLMKIAGSLKTAGVK